MGAAGLGFAVLVRSTSDTMNWSLQLAKNFMLRRVVLQLSANTRDDGKAAARQPFDTIHSSLLASKYIAIPTNFLLCIRVVSGMQLPAGSKRL